VIDQYVRGVERADHRSVRAGESALPLLGATSIEGLYVASGHFRNGIVLTPITAEIMEAVIEETPPPIDIAPSSPMRAGAWF
jgi:glycine oxidase